MVNTALLRGFSDGWLKTSMTRQIGILSSLLFSVSRIPIHQAIPRRLHDEVTVRTGGRKDENRDSRIVNDKQY
jgi:hypothetical protein